MFRLSLCKVYTAIILWFCMGLALAATATKSVQTSLANTSLVSRRIESQLKLAFPALKINSVMASPISNLYQVNIEQNKSFYVDSTANYAILGDMIDLHTKVNLSKKNSNSNEATLWDSLPLKLALKRVIGNGDLAKIAVITDPDCPFCQQLEANLSKLNNITIYYFLYPLAIHANAEMDAKSILCSKDPLNTYLARMATPDISLPENVTCSNARNLIEIHKAIKSLINLQGTPTIILADGSTIVGSPPLKYLKQNIISTTKIPASK